MNLEDEVSILTVFGRIRGRGTTGREGDEQSYGDRPEGVRVSGSRGGRGLDGSAVGTSKGDC